MPEENEKGSRGNKRDHFGHLSPFALRHSRALHALTSKTRWCFPGHDGDPPVHVKSVRKQVGVDVAIEALRDGWSKRKFSIDEPWRHAEAGRMARAMRPCIEAIT